MVSETVSTNGNEKGVKSIVKSIIQKKEYACYETKIRTRDSSSQLDTEPKDSKMKSNRILRKTIKWLRPGSEESRREAQPIS